MFLNENIFNANRLQPELKPGVVLLSEPFLLESYFFRSTVLLVEHNEWGSMGLVLNKRTHLTLNTIFPHLNELNLPSIPVFCGGPVNHQRLFYLHKFGDKIASSLEIVEGIYLGGEFNDIITQVSLHQSEIAQKVLFCVGYTGWESNQLKQETDNDSWVVTTPGSIDIEACYREDEYWKTSVRQLGTPYTAWLSYPRLPYLN